MRKRGRHVNDRIRAMRFALWAQHLPPDLLTSKQIAGLLDLNKSAACKWRQDWLKAISPVEIEGIHPFMKPNPRELPYVRLAAISKSDFDKEFADAIRDQSRDQ